MLGLVKIAGLSAAVSAGFIAALPLAQPEAQSGKQFVERLGEPETSFQIVRTGARLASATGIAGELKADRLSRATAQTETVTVERRKAGLSVLVREAPPAAPRWN